MGGGSSEPASRRGCLESDAGQDPPLEGLRTRQLHYTVAMCFHEQMHLVLETRILARRQQRCGIRTSDAEVFDPRPFGLGEIAEHERIDQALVAGMANAEPNPTIVIAAMGGDRAQA